MWLALLSPLDGMVLLAELDDKVSTDAHEYLLTTPVPAALEAALGEMFAKWADKPTSKPSVRELAEHLKSVANKLKAEAKAAEAPGAEAA